MQFATSNSTVASHDVTISDNLIYRGAGQNAQGIFLGDEVGNLPFQNFTITGNTVVGTGASAIRATHDVGLTITGNNLVTLAGGDPTTLLVQNSDRVTSSGNLASSISVTAANGNTNIIETNDVGNAAAAVIDRGAAVIQQWATMHPANTFEGLSPVPDAPATPPPIGPQGPPPTPGFVLDISSLVQMQISSHFGEFFF
jgi:hypothetical protein